MESSHSLLSVEEVAVHLHSLPDPAHANWEIAEGKWPDILRKGVSLLAFRCEEAHKHNLPSSAFEPLFEEARLILRADAARRDVTPLLLSCPKVLRELALRNARPHRHPCGPWWVRLLLSPCSMICFFPVMALLLPLLLLLLLANRLALCFQCKDTSQEIALRTELGKDKGHRRTYCTLCGLLCYLLGTALVLALHPVLCVLRLLLLSWDFRQWTFVLFHLLLPNLCRSRGARIRAMCGYSVSVQEALEQRWRLAHPGVAEGLPTAERTIRR